MQLDNIEDLLNQIIWLRPSDEIIDSIIAFGPPVVIGILVFGLIHCFFGRIIFRYEMALIGAGGLGAATYIGLKYLVHYDDTTALYGWTAFAAFMGFGMMFTVSAILIFMLTLIAMTGYLAVQNTIQCWNMSPAMIIIIAAAVALIAGILYKHVLILLSVIIGAGSAGFMCGRIFDDDFFGVIITVVFGLLGLFVQYWMYIKIRRREKELDAEEKEEKLAKKIAKKTKVVDPTIEGVDTVPETPVDYSKVFMSQTEVDNATEIPTYLKAKDDVKADEIKEKVVDDVKVDIDKAPKTPPVLKDSEFKAPPIPRSMKSIKDELKADSKPDTADDFRTTITDTGTFSTGDVVSKVTRKS
ncbi:MAG: hypothetical protein II699_04190 [Lachnospiraceae bacterium]|nr:hypothetical protein [Lachnospiraceae bacterium]